MSLVKASGAYKKYSWGGFHSVAYGRHLYLVCVVCDIIIWHHIHVSKQHFGEVCWHNMHILLHALFLSYVSYKLSALQVEISGENTLTATTQQLVNVKISGFVLKQGNKTQSSLCQSNLQVQNQAVLMSHRIQAVGHRCVAGLAGAHPNF